MRHCVTWRMAIAILFRSTQQANSNQMTGLERSYKSEIYDVINIRRARFKVLGSDVSLPDLFFSRTFI